MPDPARARARPHSPLACSLPPPRRTGHSSPSSSVSFEVLRGRRRRSSGWRPFDTPRSGNRDADLRASCSVPRAAGCDTVLDDRARTSHLARRRPDRHGFIEVARRSTRAGQEFVLHTGRRQGDESRPQRADARPRTGCDHPAPARGPRSRSGSCSPCSATRRRRSRGGPRPPRRHRREDLLTASSSRADRRRPRHGTPRCIGRCSPGRAPTRLALAPLRTARP